jgi:GNAT superfamily N-acetyltransferase
MSDPRVTPVWLADVRRRWQAMDALLPIPDALPDGCGADLAVTGPGGDLIAAGSCEHWEGDPGSLDLTWGAARRFELRILAAGLDVPAALDALLARWSEHLAEVPDAGAPDTAAVVTWPSRDIDGPAPLLRHGLAPLAVIAARANGLGPAEAAVAAGVKIRRAEPADIESVVQLGLEVVRFDSHFGGVNERSWTAEALTREVEELLAEPQPWVWLAEQAGKPLGMLAAERPARARWIASRTRADPVAYLLLMGVRAGERARGIGAALASQLNYETEANQVPLTLLHYAQVNPLSAPFWSQQGYRPLWTCWEARSAAAVR